MAGFRSIYCIGGEGGFMGTDGINPIYLQILLGNGHRDWLEARYFDDSIKPLGCLKTIIPEGPDDPNALLDACIAFFPEAFNSCPTLKVVESQLGDVETLDFDLKGVSPEWSKLREEARSVMANLTIYQAKLEPLTP